MNLERQKTRYRPQPDENYSDQNITISEHLDTFKHLFSGKKILDIGSGEIPFKPFYHDLDVTTSDIQDNSTNTIDHLLIPNQPLPFTDNSFDVIFLFDVLEHVQDDGFFLNECRRVLTSNGLFVATVPFMYRFHEIPHDFRRYTPSGLNYIFDIAGFKLNELKNIGSSMFTASTLLTEHQLRVVSFFRKMILKLIVFLLKLITDRNEISAVSPFSFFLIAQKRD